MVTWSNADMCPQIDAVKGCLHDPTSAELCPALTLAYDQYVSKVEEGNYRYNRGFHLLVSNLRLQRFPVDKDMKS